MINFLARIALLALMLLALPWRGDASTGCSYPASLDAWTDKIAGDFLTIADVNSFRCAIEKLETGPLRPNKGTIAAPSHSFQGDADTGFDSLAADTVSLITGGVERIRVGATGITTGAWLGSVIGSTYGGSGANLAACAQGTLPYFSATGVQSCLAVGVSGQTLTTQGPAANPIWAGSSTTVVAKTADETVNNSSTLQNDDHLICSVEASKDYSVEIYLLLSAANRTADWKFGWSLPAAATAFWGLDSSFRDAGFTGSWGPDTNLAGVLGVFLASETQTVTFNSEAGTHGVIFHGVIRVAGTAGNAQLQWAQNTANVSDSKLLKGSHLKCTKL